MALKYALFENPMTADLNDRMAVTIANETLDIEDVFAEMTRQGSTVTKAEGLAVFEEFYHALDQLLKNGNSIITPLFNLAFSIPGVFNGDEDSFDTSRHKVKLRITPGVRLREVEKQISVTKVKAERRQPILLHYYDTTTESQDSILTPGGAGSIKGSLLKFNEAEADEGIFFVNMTSAEASKVTVKPLRNKPGELIFITPLLPAGAYQLEVRSTVKGTKTLRIGSLDVTLTVL
ncbi:MAG: DNA-binding domain-containing protein [Sphingobacteriaceae bacterium]